MHRLMSLLLLVMLSEHSDGLAAQPEVWSSLRYPKQILGPTNWRYYRVDVPVGFSTLSISFTRLWKNDQYTSLEVPKPLVCFGFNGPPLVVQPRESLLEAAIAAGEVRNASVTGECGWFNDTIVVNATNFEILSGLMHIGIYTDITAHRTQSHMVSRGKQYKFALDVQVSLCSSKAFGGSQCNHSIKLLPSPMILPPKDFELNQLQKDNSEFKSTETGRDSGEECFKLGETRYFSFIVEALVARLIVNFECLNTNLFNNETSQNISSCKEQMSKHGVTVFPALRYGALPSTEKNDFTQSLSSGPLFVVSPRRGWWYLSISVPNTTSAWDSEGNAGDELCLSLNWGVQSCDPGRIGTNCQWSVLPLRRLLLPEVESPFDSYYLSRTDSTNLDSTTRWFPILTSLNTSLQEKQWEYTTLEVPPGAAGGVLSAIVRTSSNLNVELYARYEGCPTNSVWDFRVRKSDTLSQNVSLDRGIDKTKLPLHIVYPKEGTWCLGSRYIPTDGVFQQAEQNTTRRHLGVTSLRKVLGSNPLHNEQHPADSGNSLADESRRRNLVSYHVPARSPNMEMQIILHGCPNKCSGHGKCRPDREAGRLHFISHCNCDVAHGDFDCSTVLVEPRKKWQRTWLLTLSNGAAILPSLWAIQHQAYSEWITFMLSGMSSAVYHSCDSGGWCAMPFSTLQFLDFWLSFLVIIMTCLYMAGFVGPKQGMIHIGFAVLTAAIAQRNATSGWNVLVIVVMGITALLLGWGLETSKVRVFSPETWLPFTNNCTTALRQASGWSRSLYRQFRYKFRWLYLSCGLFFLFNAVLSLYLEAADTYWIWHSWWHVSIYTCAFFMLKSIVPSDQHISSDSKSYQIVEQNIRNGDIAELNSLTDY